MRILGIEGTAWCASAALYDTETDTVRIESDPYVPESGGIHPREAAEHMAEAIPTVVGDVLDIAEATNGSNAIDAVAFSRGPGLGPCLRTVATAARALAGRLDVPLVGVNHMVAHLEIGRHESGFENPVCLNASGANAHLLGYHDGRYRVLGETMDAGVGNAIDKFTRHVGWQHPGGPKVEQAALEAVDAAGDRSSTSLYELPYVVKGMDFSFSGISSAANDAYNDGEPVESICFALQEHVFAMLTEVTERALSLTGADELVIGGGVGQNARLREMLAEMCAARGAAWHAPDPRFLRDNAGMIAVLGAKMCRAGDTLPIADSTVDPNFRPDQVPVTWRSDESSVTRIDRGVPTDQGSAANRESVRQQRGAEAVVTIVDDPGAGTEIDRRKAARSNEGDGTAGTLVADLVDGPLVVKQRVIKSYRHPSLDRTLRRDRTVMEARLTSEARRAGVTTPLVYGVDVPEATITFQYVGDRDLATVLGGGRHTGVRGCVETVGRYLGRLHDAGIVHGDPTTRNVRVAREADDDTHDEMSDVEPFLIDFGLGYYSGHVEDHAMDLHVFEGSVEATVSDPDPLVEAFEAGYVETGGEDVLNRLESVRGRGRYR